jgi:hypothetical protein
MVEKVKNKKLSLYDVSLLTNSIDPTKPASQVTERSEAALKPTARRSDQDLQLTRRIDWRFLLPEPYLRRVAYFGPSNGTLPSALEHFSESFRIISSHDGGNFDLMVLRLREIPDLAKANKLLVSGGFLYWELKPINWAATLQHRANGKHDSTPKRWRRVPSLFHAHIAALTRLGFQDIQIHWHRPNFEGCLEIIPMNEATALDYAFGRPRSDLANRIKFAAGKVMMQTGLLAHLTPCFSLLARKS